MESLATAKVMNNNLKVVPGRKHYDDSRPLDQNYKTKDFPKIDKPIKVIERVERKYSNIKFDEYGRVIRGYEGMDMKAIYNSKPLAYKFVKRVFDIIASFLGLLILSPVFLITAIAIKSEDGDRSFFPVRGGERTLSTSLC